MDEIDREKIEKIISDRKRAHAKMLEHESKVYKSFLAMEAAAFSDGALAKKYKELTAVGISIVINCESCMEWHINMALKSGASEKEILEAIDVGIEMGGGPATVAARFALKVLEYYGDR